MPRRTTAEREVGFTLVELLIAVVISGMISGVLAAVLMQGLSLGGSTRDRTGFAANASLFGDRLSDDVANAVTGDTTSFLPSMPCTRRFDITYLAQPHVLNLGFVGAWNPTTAPATKISYVALLTAWTPAVNRVEIRRVDALGSRVVLAGYCLDGVDGIVADGSYLDPGPNYTLTLSLRPSPTGEVRTLQFGGTRRVLAPPADFTS